MLKIIIIFSRRKNVKAILIIIELFSFYLNNFNNYNSPKITYFLAEISYLCKLGKHLLPYIYIIEIALQQCKYPLYFLIQYLLFSLFDRKHKYLNLLSNFTIRDLENLVKFFFFIPN